jgi:molybdopterin biosynthesis enzyme
MMGHPRPVKPLVPATLEGGVSIRGDRLTLYPVAIGRSAEGDLLARPLRNHGSADLVGMVAADGFIFLPAGRQRWEKGSRVEARVW